MQVILLAAGMGTRLGSRTTEMPKSLIPVQGKPLILHILKSFESFPLSSITIVTGFQADLVRRCVPPSDKIRFVHNPDYKKGNLLSLMAARSMITETFCVTNSDHLFSNAILQKAFTGFLGNDDSSSSITAICDSDRTLTDDDMKVLTQETKGFKAVKQMDKKLTNFDYGYIGMTIVPQNKLKTYWQAAEALLTSKGEGIHVESVLNALVDQSVLVPIRDVSGSTWFEVDTESDLKNAENTIGKMDY